MTINEKFRVRGESQRLPVAAMPFHSDGDIGIRLRLLRRNEYCFVLMTEREATALIVQLVQATQQAKDYKRELPIQCEPLTK